MTISKELFSAILALDSYNQGYDSGLAHKRTKIGSATVVTDSEVEGLNGSASGFYAISYDIDASGPEGLAGQKGHLISRHR